MPITDPGPSASPADLLGRLNAFMADSVYPAESVHEAQAAELAVGRTPPVMSELRAEARRRGLWNLCLSDHEWGVGLSNEAYAPLAELTGRSALGADAINGNGPDSVNMETLVQVGTPEQQEQWLRPLAEGYARSCFGMTEPDVASSDATNIATRIERTSSGYRITGRKWWTSGAARDDCRFAIVMGVSDPEASPYRRHSMVIVPFDSPEVRLVRRLSVFGYEDGAHAEVAFDGVEVPEANLLGQEGDGFAIAQIRLGPARIQHCMRLVGMAERALSLLCARAAQRSTFGQKLSERGVIQDWIAESRIAIEAARLLVLHAAAAVDRVGTRGARDEIGIIKVVVPRTAAEVIDRAIQVYGGAGVSADTPLAAMYARARGLQIADGPDEVHKMVIARTELRRQAGG